MTHRARLFGILVIAAVLLGLVVNAVAGKVGPGTGRSKSATHTGGGAPPLSPIYVPRPKSAIIGQSLATDSSPGAVSKGFVRSYYSFDPRKDRPKRFAGSLPHLDPKSTEAVARVLTDELGGGHGKKGRAEPTEVRITKVDTARVGKGKTRAEVTLKERHKGKKKWKTGHRMELELADKADDGWVVTSVTPK